MTIETFIASWMASCDAIQGLMLSTAEKHQQTLNSAMLVLSQAGSVAHPTPPPSSLRLNKIHVRLTSLALTSEYMYLLVWAYDARNVGQSNRCNCHLCSSNKVAVSTKLKIGCTEPGPREQIPLGTGDHHRLHHVLNLKP